MIEPVQTIKATGATAEARSECMQAMGVLALDGAWAAYDFIQEQIHKGAAGL